jgi:hypothetical protein
MLRLICTLLLGALTANGASLTIGAPGHSGNGFPFGADFVTTYHGTTYQQVYGAGQFSGPVTISEISFIAWMAGDVAATTYTFSLSTTSKPVNGLDTTTLANNVGTDNTLVKTLDIPTPRHFVADSFFDVFFDIPFDYHPATGNLLLQIQVGAVNHASEIYFKSWNGQSGAPFSRATDSSPVAASNNYGLVTKFTFIPEPGAFTLVGAGLAALLLARRRPA